MPPRGRKPQTDEQKKAKGETRPSRTQESKDLATVVNFPPMAAIPKPPEYVKLNPTALKEWNRLAELLTTSKVLALADLSMLGHLCMMHAEQVERLENPRLGQISAAERAQLRLFYAEFGCTPSSRTRVGVKDNSAKNKFDVPGAPPPPKK